MEGKAFGYNQNDSIKISTLSDGRISFEIKINFDATKEDEQIRALNTLASLVDRLRTAFPTNVMDKSKK